MPISFEKNFVQSFRALWIALAILFWLFLALIPYEVSAGQTVIFNDIRAEANSGGNYAGPNTVVEGEASASVSQTTIVNGAVLEAIEKTETSSSSATAVIKSEIVVNDSLIEIGAETNLNGQSGNSAAKTAVKSLPPADPGFDQSKAEQILFVSPQKPVQAARPQIISETAPESESGQLAEPLENDAICSQPESGKCGVDTKTRTENGTVENSVSSPNLFLALWQSLGENLKKGIGMFLAIFV